MKCNKCDEVWDTAFGIVGSTQIAEPTTKCPYCFSDDIEKYDKSICCDAPVINSRCSDCKENI